MKNNNKSKKVTSDSVNREQLSPEKCAKSCGKSVFYVCVCVRETNGSNVKTTN